MGFSRGVPPPDLPSKNILDAGLQVDYQAACLKAGFLSADYCNVPNKK